METVLQDFTGGTFTMRPEIKTYLLITLVGFLVLISYKPALCQESAELRVQRTLDQINSLPNLPKLEHYDIKIDDTKQWYAYYIRYPKKHFWNKGTKVPTIHLYRQWVIRSSDDSLQTTIAHELGHHFDPTPYFIESPKSLDKILAQFRATDKGQAFAEAFALYLLGEDIFKKGHFGDAMNNYKKSSGVYWLHIESDPILYQYYIDQSWLWTNYWLTMAKTKIDLVKKLAQDQKDQ